MHLLHTNLDMNNVHVHFIYYDYGAAHRTQLLASYMYVGARAPIIIRSLRAVREPFV